MKGKRVQGVALDDTWFLKMDTDPKQIKWSKRKKIGYAPSPARSGCTMALWANKSTGVLFGGVTDVKEDEETIESVFYNDMYVRERYYIWRLLNTELQVRLRRLGQRTLDIAHSAETEEESGAGTEEEDCACTTDPESPER